MSAPRKIYAWPGSYPNFADDWMNGECRGSDHTLSGGDGGTLYHHNDVVRELVEAANQLVNNPGWGTVKYTDEGMWTDGEALRAALAKIAQEG